MDGPIYEPYLDEAMAADFDRHAEDSIYNAHYDRPAVLDLVGDVRGKRVLDAACGPGYYSGALLARGADVAGFDASEAMLRRARTRAPLADFQVASLDDLLPYGDAMFDMVVCALAIHYATDRSATLREFARVLRPGGSVVFSTQHPTADWLRKGGSYFDVRLEEDVWKASPPTRMFEWRVHFWREPLSALTEAAFDAGFLIERLIEPLPSFEIRARDPETYDELRSHPGFVVFRLVKRALAL